MVTLNLSTTVQAPPEHVFDIFTDLENAVDRVEGIIRMELLGDGPVGKGTRWRETRIMFKKETTEEMWISAYDPPRSYTVQADSCGSDFFTTFTFTREGDGTKVDMEVRTKSRTIFAKLMSPLGALFAGAMKKLMKKDLDDLKQVAEAG